MEKVRDCLTGCFSSDQSVKDWKTATGLVLLAASTFLITPKAASCLGLRSNRWLQISGAAGAAVAGVGFLKLDSEKKRWAVVVASTLVGASVGGMTASWFVNHIGLPSGAPSPREFIAVNAAVGSAVFGTSVFSLIRRSPPVES